MLKYNARNGTMYHNANKIIIVVTINTWGLQKIYFSCTVGGWRNPKYYITDVHICVHNYECKLRNRVSFILFKIICTKDGICIRPSQCSTEWCIREIIHSWNANLQNDLLHSVGYEYKFTKPLLNKHKLCGLFSV